MSNEHVRAIAQALTDAAALVDVPNSPAQSSLILDNRGRVADLDGYE